MAYLNDLAIIGNLGRDPELRYTPTERRVCTFSVGLSQPARPGEPRQTTWVRVTCWDDLASTCAEYLTKGRQVYVRGRAGVSAYAGQDGKPAATLELTAASVVFLGPKPQEQSDDVPF